MNGESMWGKPLTFTVAALVGVPLFLMGLQSTREDLVPLTSSRRNPLKIARKREYLLKDVLAHTFLR